MRQQNQGASSPSEHAASFTGLLLAMFLTETAMSAPARSDEIPTPPPAPGAVSPENRQLFDRFWKERERRQAIQAFERFLAEHPHALAASAPADARDEPPRPSAGPRTEAGVPTAPPSPILPRALAGSSPPPPLAAPAPPRRSDAPGATTAADEARLDGDRVDLASLEGDWCSDLVIYDGLPPLQWALVSPRRVRIIYPVLAGEHRGEVRTKRATIQPGADGTVRLVTDNRRSLTETVYAVERRALRGVSHRQVDKATGVEKSLVPDSFRRCEQPTPIG
jgi:hypothetical protein